MDPTDARKRSTFPKKWHVGLGAIALAGGWLGMSQAFSQDNPADALPEEWQVFFEERQVPITKTFSAGNGITGILAADGPSFEILYILEQSNTMTPGPLLDSDGNMLTDQHALEHHLGDTLNEVWGTLNERSDLWLVSGDANAERFIYTFDDPNCPYCAEQYRLLTPMIERGELQVRHLLMGLLQEDSAALAAAALSSSDPGKAYGDYQAKFGEPGAKTALLATGNPDDAAAARIIEENFDLMQSIGINATPGVIYPPQNGDEYPRIASGVQSPKEIKEHFER